MTMHPTYGPLDGLILEAIRAGKSPLYNNAVTSESDRISEATGRPSYRIIDGRLIALRKSGKIEHLTKLAAASRGKRAGWNIKDAEA